MTLEELLCMEDEVLITEMHQDRLICTYSEDCVKRIFCVFNINLLTTTCPFKNKEDGQGNRKLREVPEERIWELWHGCGTLMDTVITSASKCN